MSNDTIKLSEMFGPTIQGEGSRAGRLAAFIRVFGCPLYCWFCDSAYTWRFNNKHPHKSGAIYDPKEEVQEVSFQKILASLADMNWPPVIVFTGGEPMLYDEKLYYLGLEIDGRMLGLTGQAPEFEIETAGMIEPKWLHLLPGVRFNVSPKLESSKVALGDRLNVKLLNRYANMPATTFKFVVSDWEKDIPEIRMIQNRAFIPNRQIYLMPEGETAKEQLERTQGVMELAIGHGWNFSPRLHTLAWGNERGK